MALLALNDIVRVTLFGTQGAQRILNVFKLRVTNAPTGLNIFDQLNNLAAKLADTVAGPMLPAWVPLVGPAFTFDKVRCQRQWPVRSVYGEALIGQAGTSADQTLTPNQAISVEKRSSVPGRKGVGRVQVAGIPGNSFIDGIFNTTFVTDIGTAFQFLKTDFTVAADTGKYRWCLFSGGVPPDIDDIIDVNPKPEVRDMRRRTVGLGI
jgi:hypothetical protein